MGLAKGLKGILQIILCLSIIMILPLLFPSPMQSLGVSIFLSKLACMLGSYRSPARPLVRRWS